MNKQNFTKIYKSFLNAVKAKKKIAVLILAILVILISLVVFFIYNNNKNSQTASDNLVKKQEFDDNNLVKMVSNLIDLPKNEIPKIAIVSDKTKLADKSFFKNAENGDRVLIYVDSGRIILYRPSINKIIEVAATVKENEAAKVSVTPKQTKTYKIVILNGTKTVGLASRAADNLTSQTAEFIIANMGDAVNGNYTDTLVIDLGGGIDAAKTLAGLVGGKVGELPNGEKAPAGIDFLVILAK